MHHPEPDVIRLLLKNLKDTRSWERKQSAERLGRLKGETFEKEPWIRPEAADIILKHSGAVVRAVDSLGSHGVSRFSRAQRAPSFSACLGSSTPQGTARSRYRVPLYCLPYGLTPQGP